MFCLSPYVRKICTGLHNCAVPAVHFKFTFYPHLICYSVIETFILYQAARETGALQAAKNKLEKQVEDLTLRLQLEKRIRVNNYYFQRELLTVIVLF